MGARRLDQDLLEKIARRTKRTLKSVRESISHKASNRGVSSEAAMILWARELGIGSNRALQKLPAHLQQQVQDSIRSVPTTRPLTPSAVASLRKPGPVRRGDPVRAVVDALIADDELRDRCADLLRAKGKFDRAIREATTVLDDRIKTLGEITVRMNPVPLVSKVLNPNPANAVLVVSPEPNEQEGFFSICKGLMLVFRDRTHHKLTDRITREEALKICAFIDVILAVLGDAKKAAGPVESAT